MFLTLW
jgi:hypothetical protein